MKKILLFPSFSFCSSFIYKRKWRQNLPKNYYFKVLVFSYSMVLALLLIQFLVNSLGKAVFENLSPPGEAPCLRPFSASTVTCTKSPDKMSLFLFLFLYLHLTLSNKSLRKPLCRTNFRWAVV